MQFQCNSFPYSAAKNFKIPLEQSELKVYLQVHDPYELANSLIVAF